MVLYLNEFLEYANNLDNTWAIKLQRIKKFETEKKYLHDMTGDELINLTNSTGTRGVYMYRQILIKYLQWLKREYFFDTSAKIYKLKNTPTDNTFIGFLNIKELREAVDEAIDTAQYNGISVNVPLVTAVYYLEWYGVRKDDMLSIMRDNVTDLGRKIFVPAQDRAIEIDDEQAADFFQTYKYMEEIEGIRKIVLKGDTLLRTSHEGIKNTALRKVYASMDDIRLHCNVTFESGACYRLYQIEQKQHSPIITNENFLQIKSEFHLHEMSSQTAHRLLRLYAGYKEAYIARLKEMQDKENERLNNV